MNANFEIKDGEYTSTIYGMIKDQRWVGKFLTPIKLSILIKCLINYFIFQSFV